MAIFNSKLLVYQRVIWVIILAQLRNFRSRSTTGGRIAIFGPWWASSPHVVILFVPMVATRIQQPKA